MRRALRALTLLLVVWLVAPLAPSSAALTSPTTIYTYLIGDLAPRLAGQPTDFTATLASGDNPVVGRQLTLWLKPYGSSAFSAADHATTDANGTATAYAVLMHNATVRWTFAGDSAYSPSVSTTYVVPISPRVKIRVNDRTLRRGQRFVVRGRTYPVKAGCTVRLWRGELRPLVAGPRPVRLATSTVRSDGTYRLVRRFHRKARMRVAVTVAPCTGNARGLSPYVRIWVR